MKVVSWNGIALREGRRSILDTARSGSQPRPSDEEDEGSEVKRINAREERSFPARGGSRARIRKRVWFPYHVSEES